VSFVFLQLIDAPDVVAATVLSNFIESCVWRITEFDIQTVEQAILSFNFSLEIISIYSVDIAIILREVLDLSCPGQPICSGHGSCIDAFCICDAGYHFFRFVFGSHLATVFVLHMHFQFLYASMLYTRAVIYIKCKKLISLQHRVKAMKSHIQNSTNHVFWDNVIARSHIALTIHLT